MGKVDDLRTMREARFAAASRSAKAAPAAPARSSVATATRPVSAAAPAATDGKAAAKARAAKKSTLTVVSNPDAGASAVGDAGPSSTGAEPAALFAVPAGALGEPEAEPEVETELCGHRAISGKTCIREAKHAEKNHKYAKS